MTEYLSALMVCLQPINLLLIIAMVSLGIVSGTFRNPGHCPFAAGYLRPFH